MRTAGAFPSYPLNRRAAEDRAASLRRRVADLEAVLARPTQSRRRPVPTPDEVWAARDGWVEELAGIESALRFVDVVMPTLQRCGCGKLVHLNEESARRHRDALGVVNEDLDARPLRIYQCTVRRELAWHVGHSSWNKEKTDAHRPATI